MDNLNRYNVVCEPLADKQGPRTSSGAQFALPFVIASVLARGRLTLLDLASPALEDASVRALAARVVPEISAEARAAEGRSGYPPGRIEVTLGTGEVLRAEIAVSRGHPDRPMSEGELVAKFRDGATAGGMSPAAQDRAIETVVGLEHVSDVRALADATVVSPTSVRVLARARRTREADPTSAGGPM